MRVIVLLLTLLSGCVYTVHEDYGGILGDRIDLIERYEDQNITVEIAGKCFSACTMHLKNGCVYPDAVLGFHSAVAKDGEYSILGTMLMTTYYPLDLQSWFWASDASFITGQDMVYITGQQAIKLGAKECKKR